MRFKLLRNQKGMNIVEVMVAAGLVSIMVYTSSTFYQQYKESEGVAKYRETAANLRQIVLALLTSEEAWNKTVEENAAINPSSDLACLRRDTTIYCPVDAEALQIKVFTASGKYQDANGNAADGPIIDNSPNAGFTKNGVPCTDYDPVNGNDACPIRIEVDWRGACSTPRPPPDSSTCKIVQSLIEARFYFKSTNEALNNSIQINRYNFRNAARLVFETDTPAKICSDKGKFYLPVLDPAVDPDSPGNVDPEGCVPMTVF